MQQCGVNKSDAYLLIKLGHACVMQFILIRKSNLACSICKLFDACRVYVGIGGYIDHSNFFFFYWEKLSCLCLLVLLVNVHALYNNLFLEEICDLLKLVFRHKKKNMFQFF